MRQTMDPAWIASHSRLEHWTRTEEQINRFGWFHDASVSVGSCGDKAWMHWLMNQFNPGDRVDGCLGAKLAHADEALCMLSNQDVGVDATNWLEWWEDNESKSQEEWIADGFHIRGFEIDALPSEKDFPQLLQILGTAGDHEVSSIHKAMKYNAFRFLRDSGFEPIAYAISNQTMSIELERGLLEYAKYEASWPTSGDVGILSFGKKENYLEGRPLPGILQPRIITIANKIIYGLPLIGLILLGCSTKSNSRKTEPKTNKN